MSTTSGCPIPSDAAALVAVGEPIAGSLTFQHTILITSIGCLIITACLSLLLILRHLGNYTNPAEQRQVIRVILTPIIFALASVLSILNYTASIYVTPFQDLYEAFALAALFLLFVRYVTAVEETRETYYTNLPSRRRRGMMIKFWDNKKGYDIIPGGIFKWFKTKWVAVYLYCIIMIITTIAQEWSQAIGTYCLTSSDPRFVHIWVLVLQNVFVSCAVNGILLYFFRIKGEMTGHKPILKLISFKLIVGVNFFQELIFEILTMASALSGHPKVTLSDQIVGIPAVLTAFEQVLFAAFFFWSFRVSEYRSSSPSPHHCLSFPRALLHALNPVDLLAGMWEAVIYMCHGVGPFNAEIWSFPIIRRLILRRRGVRNGGEQYTPISGEHASAEQMDSSDRYDRDGGLLKPSQVALHQIAPVGTAAQLTLGP